jgi:hypothetical protein
MLIRGINNHGEGRRNVLLFIPQVSTFPNKQVLVIIPKEIVMVNGR